ncbi:hypothetical protein [Corynebacterium accolens]|uniref:hypothetical protein n=1 Tax=Corynebacterium accolens TaxID=38284 RepID=UPI00019C372D|nr:hypothetical protein [Corynebacterium accolens]EEI14251.1 hypothetical protein HMPREF0276_1830 [Corynebacterium accolens ATCC 49725]UQZ28381.1 hypothetical protein CACC_08455 [Corynebacterium accolens]
MSSSPITFIAWDAADLDGVREVLAGLRRDGIFLYRAGLALETSWLGEGAQDFYGTAWEWGPENCELFFELARRGKLLMTIDATVICCGSDIDAADAQESIAQELVVANSAQELKRLLIGAEETR